MTTPIPDETLADLLTQYGLDGTISRRLVDGLIAAYRESQQALLDSRSERHWRAELGRDEAIERAEKAEQREAALRARISQRIEAWIRHGEAVPADVTTYDRAIVHMELRDLAASLLSTSTDRADGEAL